MESEENEEVVKEVLGELPGFQLRRAGAEIAPLLADGVSAETITGADGALRTSPATTHTDGFYAAVIERS
jgi:16S rRNA C967 or C1407 C5-methylase (RsmB/RsmF family)